MATHNATINHTCEITTKCHFAWIFL